MPTVLLLDVSLSMQQPVYNDPVAIQKAIEENTDVLIYKHLASLGCKQIIDHFQQHLKLEFTALIIFSSLYEVVVRFTRDFDSLQNALDNVETFDKTNIQVGLVGASQHILEEWGNGTPCQIVLVTDGNIGRERSELMQIVNAAHSHGSSHFPVPFPFPAKLNIVCITNPDDPLYKLSEPIYLKILEMNGEGNFYAPEGTLTPKSVTAMFDKLIEENFQPYTGKLQFGNFSANISLSPPPQPYNRHRDFEIVRETVCEKIEILGFLDIFDVSSPPAFSRHLVLHSIHKDEMSLLTKEQQTSDDEGGVGDKGKVPSFCVLLHGGLKQENAVALCEVGKNWFGIFYNWADSKKKSNLMLSIFEPGDAVIPWIGKLSNLGPASTMPVNPYADKERPSPFPLKVTEKRSYAQNCVVWVRPGGLQSDVQKILRHARKLPEKYTSFNKELNRVRKAALMYGFPELLAGLACLLERECYNLPGHTHPEAAIQLQHAADALKSWDKKDPSQNITHYKNLGMK